MDGHVPSPRWHRARVAAICDSCRGRHHRPQADRDRLRVARRGAGAMNAYRAGTIKRVRRTQTEVDQLDAQIIEVLRADHPQSVRHVFYRMTDPRLPEPVEKSDRGYRHVQDRCVKLRRAGIVPYAWIADMSRRGYFVNTFQDAGDFLRRMNGLYRADLWANADYRCEVWVEL